jgi:hypothetical protein
MAIPNNFDFEGRKDTKCCVCELMTTCFHVEFSCWNEGGHLNICIDCIQKELSDAY